MPTPTQSTGFVGQPIIGRFATLYWQTVSTNWRVERTKLHKDKAVLIYNEFLTLEGIAPETLNTASATAPCSNV